MLRFILHVISYKYYTSTQKRKIFFKTSEALASEYLEDIEIFMCAIEACHPSKKDWFKKNIFYAYEYEAIASESEQSLVEEFSIWRLKLKLTKYWN